MTTLRKATAQKTASKPGEPARAAIGHHAPGMGTHSHFKGAKLGAERRRAAAVLDLLEAAHPGGKTALDFRNPYELLVATVLSAQCTDVRVNIVTPALFDAFPDAHALSQATAEDIAPFIKTCGLYKSKAANLAKTGRLLVERHGGDVPHDRAALEDLPGVGRKTANVVLANAFGEPEIAVDTHVGRVARRLGFTQHTDPDKVEADLKAVIVIDRRARAHHALIDHGRAICDARKPRCSVCPVLAARLCRQAGVELSA
jgi:endonuclease III